MHKNLLQKALQDTEQAKAALTDTVLQLENNASKTQSELPPPCSPKKVSSPGEKNPGGEPVQPELAEDQVQGESPGLD